MLYLGDARMIRSLSAHTPLALIILVLGVAGDSGIASAQHSSSVMADRPMMFEQNKGQVPPVYRFLARRNGIETLFRPDGMDVFVPKSQSSAERFEIRWAGANSAASMSGEEELPGHSNYFHGADQSHWLRGIPQYARLRYAQMYEGIDLLFYGNGNELENDFVVAAGSGPDRIAFRIGRPVRLNSSGDLEIVLE